MKKITLIFTVMFIISAVALTADFRPYGSARVGYWYENQDQDWSSTGESELNLNYFLHSNSRFGARFEHEDISGRVEFGGTGSIRLLYARYKMEGWSLLVGQNNTGVEQKAKQAWDGDKDLVGWGGIDESRKPQVMIELDNGLYLGFIRPETVNAVNASQDKTVLLPKINLGYNGKLSDNIKFKGTFGLNHYTYNENAGDLDHAVMAYIVGLLFDFDLDPVTLTTHFNYGQNTRNYGLSAATPNTAIYDAENDEIVDVMTMGGFGQLTYKFSPSSMISTGVGYIASDSDAFDNADSAMAAFLQFEHRLHRNVRLIPEVGLIDKMKDVNDNEEGSMIYFGTQLRMDF